MTDTALIVLAVVPALTFGLGVLLGVWLDLWARRPEPASPPILITNQGDGLAKTLVDTIRVPDDGFGIKALTARVEAVERRCAAIASEASSQKADRRNKDRALAERLSRAERETRRLDGELWSLKLRVPRDI